MALLPGVVLSDKQETISKNFSGVAQALTAATEAVIAGATTPIPLAGLKIGSTYRVKLAINKDGNGSATSAYKIGLVAPGVAVSVANTQSVLSFTKPAGTAVADVGVVEILVTVLALGDAAEDGSVIGTFSMNHNLAATGHLQIPSAVIAGLDASTATILYGRGGGYMVLTVTTGASDVSSVLWAEGELITPPAPGAAA